MRIHVGCEMIYQFPQPTPIIAMLNVHASRFSDLEWPDHLGGRWHTFDPRNNSSRIGRILIAYGRDAADMPLTLTFGPNDLVEFTVTTEEAPFMS